MSLDVVGGHRLLEPADVGAFVETRAADRFIHRERLIGVGEYLEPRPQGLAKRREPLDVFVDRPPDLHLGAAEAEAFACFASATSASKGRCSQPPSVV